MCLVNGQFVWSRTPDGKLVLTVKWDPNDPGVRRSAEYGSMGRVTRKAKGKR